MVKEGQPTEKFGKRNRVQFDMNPDSIDRMDRLQKAIGVPTRAEVVRNMLRMYSYFVEKAENEEGLSLGNTDLRALVGLPMKEKS